MGEIVATLLPFVIEGLKIALENAIKEGIKYVVRKVINEAGKTVIRFITEGPEETVIYELDASLAQLSGVWNSMGLTLGNCGDEVGFGIPIYELVSHNDLLLFLDIQNVSAYDEDTAPASSAQISVLGSAALVDFDGDGETEPLFPVPDFDGDGQGDWGRLVDDDDNGLPDLSPDLPFYPVGSDEFTYIVEQQTKEERPIMETPLDSYSVTEGLLLLALLFSVLNFVRGLFTRKDVFR